jgi:hypothetical protein
MNFTIIINIDRERMSDTIEYVFEYYYSIFLVNYLLTKII